MNTEILTWSLIPANTQSATLANFLLTQERDRGHEIFDFCVQVDQGNAANAVNVYSYRLREDEPDADDLIVAKVFPDAPATDALAKAALEGHRLVAYSKVKTAQGDQRLLLMRKGEVVATRGKMSTFGGPEDKGMRADEGLAIVNRNNFSSPAYKDLFLDATKGPLGRNLDPDKHYLACRWPRSWYSELATCPTFVTNPLTGNRIQAEPVDFGPGVRTGRVADLSPGLAKALGLKTDDDCIVEVFINPGMAAPQPAAAGNLKVLSSERDLTAAFGSVRALRASHGDGSVEVAQAFEDALVEADISALRGIKGVPASCKVKCHAKIKDALEAAMNALGDKTSLILTWDGLYVPRHILWDSSRGLSTHTWGIAFDINAHWNGYGSPPAQAGQRGSVMELVDIFAAHGFTWGGWWRSPDGMHFQYGAV